MDINNMKNMIVIKNLPSNLIEEAYVVLKDNVKVHKKEITLKNNNKIDVKNKDENYVIKEAELLLQEYASKLDCKGNPSILDRIKLEEKCKKLKYATIFLGMFSFLSAIVLLAR